MKADDQGARRDRHHVIPRTLLFVARRNAHSGRQELLLLRGAPDKRLWANRYNGLGGHVEADEDVWSAAERELAEEAGIAAGHAALTLRGLLHIDTGRDETGAPRPGVLVFVFRAEVAADVPADVAANPPATREGTPEWLPVDGLDGLPLMDDLPLLLPRVLADGPLFSAHYAPAPDGTLQIVIRT